MKGQSKHSKPLCRYINNCKTFKTDGTCIFSHDKCQFGAKCKNPVGCKFYHPELTGVSTRPVSSNVSAHKTDRSQILCRFGPKCKNLQEGTCPFNHNSNPQNSQLENGKRACPYGQSCRFYQKGACRNYHPSNDSNARPDSPRQNNQEPEQNRQEVAPRNIMSEQPAPKKIVKPLGPEAHNLIVDFQRTKLCQRYALGQCLNPYCPKTHNLSVNNTLLRVFFSPLSQINQRQPQTPNYFTVLNINNEQLLALSFSDNRIGLFEMNSTFNMLRNICFNEFRVESGRVVGLFTRPFKNQLTGKQEDQLIYLSSDEVMHVANLTTGELTSQACLISHWIIGIKYLNMGEGKQPLQIIANSNTGVSIERAIVPGQSGNSGDIPREASAFLQKYKTLFSAQIVDIEQTKVQQNEVIVYACKGGDLVVMRQDFQSKHIKLEIEQNHSPVEINGISCVNTKGVVYVLVAAENKELGKCYVISVSLATFTWGVALTYPMMQHNNGVISRISKIKTISKNVFLGVDGVGVLMFEAPSFNTPVARVPASGVIDMLYVDGNSTMVMTEGNLHNGSLGVFKVKV